MVVSTNIVPQTKKAAFLEAYAECGNISVAAEHADINRASHYDWLESDPDYPQAFENAKAQAIEVLEAEAHRRAVKGVEEPVGWYKGKPGGTVRRYSDNLLMFLLKAAKPNTYRERVEHTGPDGGPITIAHLVPPRRDDE
jgi:hypothetical protein